MPVFSEHCLTGVIKTNFKTVIVLVAKLRSTVAVKQSSATSSTDCKNIKAKWRADAWNPLQTWLMLYPTVTRRNATF